MHLDLVVPALFGARTAAPAAARTPALELLLARGRRTGSAAAALEPWLCGLFGVADAAVPAGALTALARGEDTGGQHWLRADPVHLRADRDCIRLVPSHAFALAAEESAALAGALEPLLAGRYRLFALASGEWSLRVDHGVDGEASGAGPIELAGADVDPHLPPKPWHTLLTELQMALHRHPVNAARERRGEPAVNSVWLWGAGRLPSVAQAPWQSVSADDPVALGLARLARTRHRSPGAGALEWLERAPEDGRHLVVLDGLRGAHALGDQEALERRLRAMEENWFAPLLAALKSGRIGMLSIHVPDGAAAFETVRGDLRRFWRRARPLASYQRGAA